MDFSLTAEQEALRELTRRVLADGTRRRAAAGPADADPGIDLGTWRALAGAGVAGVGLPEAAGGGGGGFLDVCVVLEEVGRVAAPVPALAVMALAGPVMVRAGRLDALAGVADGDRIVTAALHEPVGDVLHPATTARGGRLSGIKTCVAAGTVADAFVVGADDGLHLVAAGAAGVAVEPAATTSGVPEAVVTLDGAPAERLAGPAGLAALCRDATAAACVAMAGLARAALDLTAGYVKERRQFDRPLASFQAVSQRAADAYIDADGVALTAWQAAWLLDRGLPADAELAVAAYWACEAGERVVHAATHLHGGVGVDRAYPLAALFLSARHLELGLGGATRSLARLGRILADEPVAP